METKPERKMNETKMGLEPVTIQVFAYLLSLFHVLLTAAFIAVLMNVLLCPFNSTWSLCHVYACVE